MPDEPADLPMEDETAPGLPRSRIARLRAGLIKAREQVEARRETSTTIGVAFDAYGQDLEAGGPVLAAALGFRVFLFLIPYATFGLIVAGYAADLFGWNIGDMIRGRGIAALTANGVTTAHDWSVGARLSATAVIVYALFVSARSFLRVLRIVHTLVWRTAPSRMQHATRATLVFIGVVTVSIALSGLIVSLRHRFLIGGIAALALYTVVAFVTWWLVSWWLPHDCDLLGLVPGAAVAALGIEALHVVTVVWFPRSLANKSEIYGTIGAALALLFWSYLLGRLMAIAAALNVALWRRRASEPPSLPGFLTRVPLAGAWLTRTWTFLTTRPGESEPTVDPRE